MINISVENTTSLLGQIFKMADVSVMYFAARGRAEAIRWLLHFNNVGFEDNRIDPADWPDVKPNTVTGQVPEVGYYGLTLVQTSAILMYLATMTSMYGSTPEENYKNLMINECGQDFLEQLFRVQMPDHHPGETDEEVLAKFKGYVLPNFFDLMLKFLDESNGEFLTGNDVRKILGQKATCHTNLYS